MTQVVIDDIIPRTQLVAAGGQTVFNTNWTADAASDVNVYARGAGVDANDVTQLVSSSLYTVTFVGGSQTVRVTFLSGRTLGDIITIVRNTPAERMNLYINTNFVPEMLNEDFGILTLVDQQAQMYDTVVTPHYNVSATIESATPTPVDVILPILGPNQIWAMNDDRTEIIAYDVPSGGGIAPSDATYLIKTSSSDLPNAQVMGALASGLVVNTTTTGVQITRVLTPVTNQTSILNGTGIGGNPTIGIADNPILPGNEGIGIPSGTTAQRPVSPVSTDFRFNTDLIILEYWDGSSWVQISETDGVVTITGTENQVLANGTFGAPVDGAVTLTLPQDIDTGATPEFNNIQLSGGLITDINGNTVLGFQSVINAVNYLKILNNITGQSPIITTDGPDTNIAIAIQGKGEGKISFVTSNTTTPFTFFSGTNSQHATSFDMANTAQTRTVTWQDSDGTVAWTSQLPNVNTVNLTNGQLWIGSTGNPAVAANLTAGPGVSIANSAGGIIISATGSGTGFTEVTGTSQNMTADGGYVSNNAGLVTLTLPVTAAFGSSQTVVGLGSGGWRIAQNSGQQVIVGGVATTLGAGGSLSSTNRYDSIDLLCVVANTLWVAWGAPQSAGLTIV